MLLASWAAGSPAAWADKGDDRAAARVLADAGFAHFQAGRYAQAVASFEAAEARFHAPTNLLFLARSLASGGRLLQARTVYRRLTGAALDPSAPAAFHKALEDGRGELRALEERLPSVLVVVRGAPAGRAARVTIDDVAVVPDVLERPIALDPGEHTIVADVDGAQASAHVRLGGGSTPERVELLLSPTPSAPPAGAPGGALAPSTSPWAKAAFGVGGVGLALGIGTGAASLTTVAHLKSLCPTNPCDPSNAYLADRARALGTTSTVAFVVGTAAAGAGVVLLAALPRHASVSVGPGRLMLRGSF